MSVKDVDELPGDRLVSGSVDSGSACCGPACCVWSADASRWCAVGCASLIVALVGWRAAWLSASVPNVTADADVARFLVEQETGSFLISFADSPGDPLPLSRQAGKPRFVAEGASEWDASLPIWITPGEDGQPGWATWDDNQNGAVDEPAELGAAWSDDYCVVQLPDASESAKQELTAGRILDRGAYRPASDTDLSPRTRYVFETLPAETN
ncbi:hypothetical protein SAMN06265222_12437 [Neorhodopirellula lusitana]|uniref:Uncharacterized protein n=1 Tax=Neorhodopirellula lusitana TaxID=445327 RepID=A0ABY1QSV3_9BACT|nr:hypothetical protein [Neorhodopirellula lusitana]SMP78037.1 hypothetical protein SAMN06265222_12437 [Neorhodopirellula lusitana]